jgi:hypothetical protein
MDDNDSSQNSPSVTGNSDTDFLDLDDQESRASFNSGGNTSKRSSKNMKTTVVAGEKGESKVLEWSSFSPHIIRQKYLQRLREINK